MAGRFDKEFAYTPIGTVEPNGQRVQWELFCEHRCCRSSVWSGLKPVLEPSRIRAAVFVVLFGNEGSILARDEQEQKEARIPLKRAGSAN